MSNYQAQNPSTEIQPNNSHYVYLHTRLTDGLIFYVGLGNKKRAWSKQGRSAFWQRVVAKHGYSVSFVVQGITLEEARAVEVQQIALHRGLGVRLCNLTDGGEGIKGYARTDEQKARISLANRGKKRTPEQKANISKATLGRKLSVEHVAKIAAYRTGRPRTEETKAKLRLAHTGKKIPDETKAKMTLAKRNMSDETKAKMSASAKARGESSEATREKLSRLAKGRVHSEESRRKMSEAQKLVVRPASRINHLKTVNIGRVLSEETKKKLSSSLTGRKLSEETKAKMRIAAKNRVEAHRLGLNSISQLAQLENKENISV